MHDSILTHEFLILSLNFLQPLIPPESHGRQRENLGEKGVVHFLVLFHNKATIFPCASRTPSWENPKGCIELHRTEQRKTGEEEERRKKQRRRRKKAIVFLKFQMPLFLGFSPLPLF